MTELVTQAEFAARMGVTPACVSQWKARDVLIEAAFSGVGKTGKLVLDVALAQAEAFRASGQGAALDPEPVPDPASNLAPDPDAKPDPDPPGRVVSQAELARQCGVSRSAVSQWKATGVLTAAAFTATGRVILDVALREIETRRDPGQSLGNGMDTRTEGGIAQGPPPDPALGGTSAQAGLPMADPRAPQSSAFPAKAPDVRDELAQERLETQRHTNRRLAEEEAERRGQFMRTEDVRAQYAQIASAVMAHYEGAVPELAQAIAASFAVPERDVVHLLKTTLVEVRNRAAKDARGKRAELERTVAARLSREGAES